MGRAFDGSYAEYALLPNMQVYPITSSLSWSDLAAVPETYYTAFGSMQNLQIKPTDTDNTLATEECFDKILELVGPASIKDSFAHIKEYGIICSTGLLGGKWYLEDFDPTRDLLHKAYLTTFYSGGVNAEKINALFAYIEQYHVPVAPERVFTLDEAVTIYFLNEGRWIDSQILSEILSLSFYGGGIQTLEVSSWLGIKCCFINQISKK